MTAFNITMLGGALVKRLQEAFTGFKLENENPAIAADQSVTVYLGAVPKRERGPSNAEVRPQFPLVIVRPRAWTDAEGESNARFSVVQVDFIIGTRRLDAEGFLDVTAIAERIRTNLLANPYIEKNARMELPIESEIGEEDSFPQWYGLVSTRFNVPQPIEEISL